MGEGTGAGVLATAFCKWMQTQLGYQITTRRVLVRGQAGHAPYVVTIHGRSVGATWRFLFSFGVGVAVLAIVQQNVHAVGLAELGATPNRLAILGAAALVAAYAGRLRTERHAWVECLDAAKPVSTREIRNLVAAVADVRAKPAAQWQPDAVMVASGVAGYDLDAVALAILHGIECFRRTETAAFERVDNATDCRFPPTRSTLASHRVPAIRK